MAQKQKIFPFTSYESPVELTVETINEKGQGIAHFEEYEIYLDGVIDGEVVLASIGDPFANGSKRRPGTIVEFIKKSKDRADNSLELTQGGIYAYGNLTYEASLSRKQDKIKEALALAGVKKIEPLDIVKSNLNEPSRFKTVRFFGCENDSIINGFYKARSHEIIAVSKSDLEPEWFSSFANALCQMFTKENVSVYDEFERVGILRSLLLRDTQGGKLAVLVVADELGDSLKSNYLKIAKDFNIDAVFVNVNKTTGNKIVDGECVALTDTKSITLNLCDFEFKAGPNTFLQVNYPVASALYQKAVDWCGNDKAGSALDLCCGVGTMTLCLAKNFNKVTGVDIVSESIDAAKENAVLNNITNAQFVAEDLKESISALVEDKSLKAVICDPARAGIGQEACEALAKSTGNINLAYIFCSLTSLSRDVKTLTSLGFKVKSVQGFDMFPYTAHVETVVLMSRVDK